MLSIIAVSTLLLEMPAPLVSVEVQWSTST